MELRSFRESDTEAVIALIDAVYREYDDRVYLEGAEADLKEVSEYFGDDLFQVLDDGGAVRGTIAIAAGEDGTETWFLKRLYLDPTLRGGGWAKQLLDWAVETARARGATRLDLWSDVRFERAHAFYAKHGFTREGEPRTMHDSWQPYQEYFYTRRL